MGGKILFVDDEPAFLTGYELMLRPEFEIHTAVGGERGLALIQKQGPYTAVISDMRMPGMDGVQFLARSRDISPDTIRMILTGYSDATALIGAVNQGHIFQFLAKPCEPQALANAIDSASKQYQLVIAHKEIQARTLAGSIKVFTDVLATVCPEAFAKSIRISHYVRHFVTTLHLPPSWSYEAAAMLSQFGCIMLDHDLIQAAYLDTHLSAENRLRFGAHPAMAMDLLANIPPLAPVAWMISQQLLPATLQNPPHAPDLPEAVLTLGARMLKVAIAFDDLRMRGVSASDAVTRLQYRSGFDHELVEALKDVKSEDSKMALRRIPISKLTIGMILQQNVTNHAGVLVVPTGQPVTLPLLVRLEHFSRARLIDNDILALVPM
jgi:CheY-like chemotaxis protein